MHANVGRLHLKLGGMHCSLCVESVRRAVLRLPGVRSVHVSIAHEEVLVEYDPGRVLPETIAGALRSIGFTTRAPDEAIRFAEEEQELEHARRTAGVALGLLVAASALMLAAGWWGPSPRRALAMGGLALFGVLGPGRWILRNAWQSLRRGILNQDVLASAAVVAGLSGGAAGLFVPTFPPGEFFGAAVFVVGFHLIGGYFSVLVHVRASQSVRRLLQLAPRTAWRLRPDGSEEEVPVDRLQVGDLVRVRPGERVPADGGVVEGATAVDESGSPSSPDTWRTSWAATTVRGPRWPQVCGRGRGWREESWRCSRGSAGWSPRRAQPSYACCPWRRRWWGSAWRGPVCSCWHARLWPSGFRSRACKRLPPKAAAAWGSWCSA
jgi:cation transport ATPase